MPSYKNKANTLVSTSSVTQDVPRVDDEEDDDEAVDDGPSPHEDRDDPVRVARVNASRRNARAKARAVGYRRWATQSGLDIGHEQFKNNIRKPAFAAADVARMARWAPQTGDVGMNIEEFKTRMFLRDQSVSSGPLRVLQANVESFARSICKDVAMRCIESGSTRITAAHVRSVLRPFQGPLEISFSTPLGAIRHAQNTATGREDDEGTPIHCLSKRAGDDEEADRDKKTAKQTHAKILKQADAAVDAAHAARRMKKRARDEPACALATSSV